MTSYVSNSKQVEVQGQLYDSLSAAARAFGLNSDKVLERVRCGWNIYEALEIVERKLPTMNYQNRMRDRQQFHVFTLRLEASQQVFIIL